MRRNQTIEFLRIVAAFGVVAFHGHTQFRAVMYSGLIAFLIISPLVDVQLNWDKPRVASSLAKLLLLPWAFWMVVYGLVNLMRGKEFVPKNDLAGFLAGSSEHLWFLPFLFVVLVAINAIKNPKSASPLFWASLGAMTVLLLTTREWRSFSMMFRMPIPQWWNAVPAILAGIAAGLAGQIRHGRLITALVLLACLINVAGLHIPGLSVSYPIGIGIAVLAGWSKDEFVPPDWDLRAVSSCTMGVYLVHLLWLSAVGKVFEPSTLLTAVIAFFAALASVFLVRRVLPASKLVLG